MSYGGDAYAPSPPTSLNTYINLLRAEEAIQRKQRNKKRAAELPVGFLRYFITTNGKQFSCHLADKDEQSRYPVGFRECYG